MISVKRAPRGPDRASTVAGAASGAAASVRFFGSVGRQAGGFVASAAGGGNCLADPRKTTK